MMASAHDAWPALVLTAGLATRLRPLSDIRAKAALPVAGELIVSRILRWLRDAGVARVVLNLHHRADTVTRAVGDGSAWGMEVRYSWEVPVLGSAGGPRRALPLLDAEQFFIVNGDTLTDCDLRDMARAHAESDALVTMAMIERTVDRGAAVAADGSIAQFGPGPWHFIGVQCARARAFATVPEHAPYETVKQLYPALLRARAGALRAYRTSAEFLDVGTAADYLDTVDIVARREHRPLDVGVDCVLDPSARISHSVLWDRVQVLPGAELIDCIIGDDVVVPAGARYERSVVVHGRDGLIVAPF
jgi:NDP-sugar pyrophosphorylase family protein